MTPYLAIVIYVVGETVRQYWRRPRKRKKIPRRPRPPQGSGTKLVSPPPPPKQFSHRQVLQIGKHDFTSKGGMACAKCGVSMRACEVAFYEGRSISCVARDANPQGDPRATGTPSRYGR